MQSIIAKPTIGIRYFNIDKNQPSSGKVVKPDNYYTSVVLPMSLELLAAQNIAFQSKQDKLGDLTAMPKYNKNLVAEEPEGHFSFYLRNNPEKFYYKNDKEINGFLNTGYLPPVEEDEEYHVSDLFKDFIENQIAAKKDYNLAIVDSVEILDSMMTSKTPDIMVLATKSTPKLKNAKAGDIVGEKGYFEAVDVSKLSTEDAKEYKDAIEVIVPEGMPYMEIDKKGKPIMVFQRGMKYQVLDDKNIEMLGR